MQESIEELRIFFSFKKKTIIQFKNFNQSKFFNIQYLSLGRGFGLGLIKPSRISSGTFILSEIFKVFA